MDEKNHEDRPIAKRAAYTHLQNSYISMPRAERLAVSLILISTALKAMDRQTDLVETEVSVTGGETFNEKIEDIKVLATQLPMKTLVELSIDILHADLAHRP